MRCKGCGIQLSANNIDNCPNCGTAEDQGKKDELPKGIIGTFFGLSSIAWFGFGFAVLLSVLLFFATKSLTVAVSAFLILLAVIAAGFLGFLSLEI